MAKNKKKTSIAQNKAKTAKTANNTNTSSIHKIIDETIGWIGIILILLAYALNTFKVMSASSTTYLIMNVVGSLGVVYISLKKKDYQPGVLNIIWALIALVALAKIFLI